MTYNWASDPRFNPRVARILEQRRAWEERNGVRLVGTAYGAIVVPEEIAGDHRLVDRLARDQYERTRRRR